MLQSIMNGKSRTKQVDALVEHVKTKKEGDEITHDEIAKVIGEKYPTHAYRTIVHRAKRRIIGEFGHALDTLQGSGYRIASGHEQIRIGVEKARSGVKRIAFGRKVAEVIADDRLDDAGKKSRDFFVGRIAALEMAARKEANTLRMAVGRTNVLP